MRNNNDVTMTIPPDPVRPALRPRRLPSWRRVATAGAFALLIAACSGDDNGSTADAPASTPTVTTQESPTTAVAEEVEADPTPVPEEPLSSQGQVLVQCDFSEAGAPNERYDATGRFRINNPCTDRSDGPQPVDVGQMLSFEIIDEGPQLEVATALLGFSDSSHIYSGTAQGANGRFFSSVLGTGDYADEVLHMVGHSPGDGAITFDWYVGDGPPPFGAVGEFDETVEIAIECVPTGIPADAATGVTAAETCTYTSDDPRFTLPSSTDLIWEIDAGEDGAATGTIALYNAVTDSGTVRGGLVDDQGVRRWAGVADGLGDVDGVVNEIGWAQTDGAGVTTGVMLVSFGSAQN